ncbi:PREDICTED: perilipin-3-like [Vollenhovia emeryi]|uniref:perilipin-3-like n=1 Tax=Vollenhovia emeryi TaxID=411798 RepID=UPI0005F418D0|nr:PREDICTED: perilipin-3-like [Vollenhovia emeryi]XP_011881547.1 PREDICTED: perilipin-3-like [Vollenhovia emeryi]
MTASEMPRETSERPSAIVRIAYHQLSVMCGTRDPTATDAAANAGYADARGFAGTRRLLGLPVFATMTSAFCGAYAAARGSHESVTTILDHAEDGVRASLEFASPVTGRVAGFLEMPLKILDDALWAGLVFVEEKMPSVKLPPGEIYVNVKDSVRNIFTSALETLRLLFGGPKDRIEDLSNEAAQGIRKVSS